MLTKEKRVTPIIGVQFTLLLLISLSLLLSGCASTPLLSEKRNAELRQAFADREFVFRTDWYEYFHIYEGKTGHRAIVASKNPSRYLRRAAEDPGDYFASAGTVGHITDVQPEHTYKLHIHFSSNMGNRGFITIQRSQLTDQIATAAWVEDQLTHSAIQFLDRSTMVAEEVEAALPTPPQQPTLTAAPSPTLTPALATVAKPAIRQFEAVVNPSRIRHGETLKLMLDYVVESGDRETIAVTETRSLLFNGKALPGYPKEKIDRKSSGRQTSAFRQKIPSGAKSGTYTYKGEVCIETGCVSRLIRFSIEP
ncbi:MAG: hypothetical protein HPY30_01145 [Gammaproteobacteria bacterium (ex Lamellibrachia satsuma)]|nr:MAG: hypothetical protein HPY30_01145 [Gammaproteobacteria bacterium (ex Lamellibrachia satsuma)]